VAAPVQRDEELELRIDSLAFGGNGVARLDGFVSSLHDEFADPEGLEQRARMIVERMALALQGSLLVRNSPPAVADAFCHTDPSFALGLSLGLVHGFALADALARGDLSSFYEETVPELRERFELEGVPVSIDFVRKT